MPKIPEDILNCTVYLYKSREDAEKGTREGGTGFLYAHHLEDRIQAYPCIVSNWHVAVAGGFSVVRINTKDGGSDIIELDASEWTFIPGLDVAVAFFQFDKKIHRGTFVHKESMLSKSDIVRQQIGPGEDVFLVGRFIDHDGGRTNQPSVRFGNISLMPSKLVNPSRNVSDMYCIDLRCRGGYSGSPVFVYRTPGYDLSDSQSEDIKNASIMLHGTILLSLIGILTSQFQEILEVREGLKRPQSQAEPPNVPDKHHVKILSGMSLVTPSWDIERVVLAAVAAQQQK